MHPHTIDLDPVDFFRFTIAKSDKDTEPQMQTRVQHNNSSDESNYLTSSHESKFYFYKSLNFELKIAIML